MENKNTILALILMLVVWTGFTMLFPPEQQPSDVQPVKEEVVVSDEVKEPAQIEHKKVFPSAKDSVSALEDKFVDFENDIFSIQFNLRGGVVSSIKVLDYKQENDPDSDPVELLGREHNLSTLDLYSSGSLEIDDSNLYTFQVDEITNGSKVTLSTQLVNNVVLSKIYTFHKNSYLVGVDYEFSNNSATHVNADLQVRLNNNWDDSYADNRFDYVGFVSYNGEELLEDPVEDVKESAKTYSSNIDWSGFTNKYFLSSLVNKDNVFKSVVLQFHANCVSNIAELGNVDIPGGKTKHVGFDVYFGPKNIDYLSAAGKNLEEVVDFGFFAFLSKPLHVCLKFFYNYVHNYGISIIILTVIIKLLFWPLTQKSYTSMKAMQTLQPEMKKLREKYRGDKEGLNRSMMELYKEHRVNPLGGCLPMLVQIPVFIALYKVLLGTIELRHAPFAFWLTDLSVKDPYYITPIIMGVTMFVQQKMTPSTMDPMQAKMMLAMPVVFTFIFLNFPSGLVIYWLVNNLLTIFQQYLIYKRPAPVKV